MVGVIKAAYCPSVRTSFNLISKANPQMTRIRLYAGIFLVSLCIVSLQILLTRVFSVTVRYHFAFLVITITMLGLSVGAVFVQRLPFLFRQEKSLAAIGWSALLFGLSALFAMLVHLAVPIGNTDSAANVFALLFTICSLVATFVLAGICICLCLTRFPDITGRLYAADLIGAAIGSLVPFALFPFFNGPALVLLITAAAAVAAMIFAWNIGAPSFFRLAGLTLAFSGSLAIVECVRPVESSFFRLVWVSGQKETPPVYERWNAFSRVTIRDYPSLPFGWGLSRNLDLNARIQQKNLEIDSGASTPLTKFDGSFENLQHLRLDVSNLVHYLRTKADVFVVGVGGGRDILSALLFGQKSVTGAEINPSILSAVEVTYGDFVGNILKLPQVRVINDEARSFITRDSKTYDIIQISLVDTFAASASGAFVLSENSLYTEEGWDKFLKRLNPNGILSVSRWWFNDYPAEAYRTITLAQTALRNLGISNPENHILVSVNENPLYRESLAVGVITILVSPTPFSVEDQNKFTKVNSDLSFVTKFTPTGVSDPIFTTLVKESPQYSSDHFGMQLKPPTDSSPFFFHFTRIKDIFLGNKTDPASTGALVNLSLILLLAVFSSYLFLIKPLVLKPTTTSSFESYLFCLYFASIGLGFMLVEVSQMQWFGTFLGHPTYGITVVLFTLLLSSGLGSFISSALSLRSSKISLCFMLIVLLACGIVGTPICEIYRDSGIFVRITVSVALLAPMGIVMGLAFPLGMKVVQRRFSDAANLLWGINGSMSVCGGVIAVLLSITISITATFWFGVFCYTVAVFSFLRIAQKTQ